MTTKRHRGASARRRGAAVPLLLLLMAGLLALAPGATSAGAARDREAGRGGEPPAYTVIDLPSLGGRISEGRSLDNLGIVAGLSNLPGNATRHAALWLGDEAFDLGTFGGPNSAVVFPSNSSRGLIVGIAEKAELDPRQEAWSCSAFFPGGLLDPTGHICRGFALLAGEMREMPTLGGTHSFAAGANNRGEVVGWAENDVEDPDCVAPQQLQFRGVVWNPRTDELRELPPFPGDQVSTGNAINDQGQVVGISGICDQAVGRASAIHAVLWEDGEVVAELGNLGQQVWNTPVSINQRGEVVGFAGVEDDFLGAFYWSEETDIVRLPPLAEGHVHSEAWSINNRGQAVGLSCDAAFTDCRAFLYQDGVMHDLNDLAPGYEHHLRLGRAINDDGMITGQALDRTTGQRRAFLAIPVAE